MQKISQFVKTKHKNLKFKQEELVQKLGVGLCFLRELEQGKTTLRLD